MMKWTIKRKLYMGFGLAAILVVGCAGIARWAQTSATATQVAIAKTYGMLNDTEHLISYVRGVTVVQRAYLISGDEKAIATIPALRQDAAVVAKRVAATVNGNAELQEHFDRYLNDVKARVVFVNKLNDARKNQGAEATRALFNTGEDDRLLGLILGEFDAMKVIATAQLNAQEAADRKLQQTIVWSESLAALLALLLLTGIAVTLTGSIDKNVQIYLEMVSNMARKDLSGSDGEPASNDELAEAIHAINQMKRSMAEALTDVSRSSTQVATAGAEIESSAKEIAHTTHTEQGAVEHFASSLAEMNATVKDVAEHAEHASLAANDAVSSANEGRVVVQQTQEAMNRISESVRTASGDITTLGKETESIGEVVRIIQEIAGQTNLLALNAAIEAARAGEQGKGFAVVAQEVRVLAERTAKFTKEIADKIESVRQGAGRAVQSMHQGEAVVSEGVSQFNQVSAALEAITQRVEAAQQGISMIATATTQQSAATEGLTENIHSISSEVSRTAEQVDQTAMACAELAKLAAALQQVVDGFQLPATLSHGGQKAAPFIHRMAA
jgi:methyl-accepting chemotaxis protein